MEILSSYFIYLGLVLLSMLIIAVADKVIFHFYSYSIFAHNKPLAGVKIKFGKYAAPLVVLVVPLIEEIVFRLPLRLKKAGFGLCFAIITYRLIVDHFFEFDGTTTYLGLAAAVGVFLITTLLFPSRILDLLKQKYFNYLFYTSAILFALVHISNFKPLNESVLLFYPLYTLPQFFAGLCAGYIRMKHGFLSGWALHAMVNLPAAIIFLF